MGGLPRCARVFLDQTRFRSGEAGLGELEDGDTVTRTLVELGEAGSLDRAPIEERLYAQIYGQLRQLADAFLRRELGDVTIRPTELVHEAYLRLVDGEKVTWECRAHFFGAAARAMRRILVDRARKRLAAKRGGGWTRVDVEGVAAEGRSHLDVVAIDQALSRLGTLDPRLAQIVELRVFAGMPVRDVACVIGVSARTVDNDWALAKKWLRRELSAD